MGKNYSWRPCLSVTWLAFFATVYAQDQVPLIPSPMLVVYPGDFARFDCPSGITQRSTTAITWFLNGTSFTNLSLGNVTADLARTTAGHIESGILRFAAVPVEYNMTSVHCRAEFTTGNPVTSPMSVLLVQGLLDAVDPMVHVSEDFTVVLNWTAPFALLGASEITYCVDTADLTSGRMLQSECMINMTLFTYAMPLDFLCGELSFTVTPVNVVGNGTSITVGITKHTLVPPELIDPIELMSTTFLLTMSAPVCYAELRIEDISTNEIILLRDSNVTITKNIVAFSSQLLTENRDYRVTVTASNIAGNATSRTSISFHIPTTELTEPDPETRKLTTIVIGPDMRQSGSHSNSYTNLLVITTSIFIAHSLY